MAKVRELPHVGTDPAAALIGLCLNHEQAAVLVMSELEPEAWENPDHQAIAGAIKGLLQAGERVNITTVVDALTAQRKLEAVGGVSAMAEYMTSPWGSSAAESLIDHVRRHWVARRLRVLGQRMARLSGDDPLDETLSAVDRELADARTTATRRGAVAIRESVDDRMVGYGSGRSEKHPGWGIPELDAIFAGFGPGTLTILAARTSMGKTHMALHAARHYAITHGRPVLVVSLEMDGASVTDRLVAAVTDIDSQRLHDESSWDRPGVEAGIEKLRKAPLWVTTHARTLLEIRAEVIRMRSQAGDKNPGLVVIDYLGLLHDGTGETDEVLRLGRVTRDIRAMAEDMGVGALVVHQLNRAVDMRSKGNRRPGLIDLRGSGHIEEAADAVVFLYRESYYSDSDGSKHGDLAEGYTEVGLAKQRTGQTGWAPVMIDLATGHVSPVESRQGVPF